MKYRGLTALSVDEVLDRLKSDRGHVFVQCKDTSFQFSQSVGLDAGPVGVGEVVPRSEGSEILIEIDFGLIPIKAYLFVAVAVLLLTVVLLFYLGIIAALVGFIVALVMVLNYLQKVAVSKQMIRDFAEYFDPELEFEKVKGEI